MEDIKKWMGEELIKGVKNSAMVVFGVTFITLGFVVTLFTKDGKKKKNKIFK